MPCTRKRSGVPVCMDMEAISLPIVKKNQPQLYQDLLDFFDDPDAEQEEWQDSRSVQKGHGRLEIRELWASTQMHDWCETEWAGVAQVFRLHRNVQDGEKVREETVYGLTNLPRKKANASRLLALQQAHRAHRKSAASASRCPLRRRCVPSPFERGSPGSGCPQWRGSRLDGLAPGFECGFSDATFLCPSRGCLAVSVLQAFAVVRVHQKALP
jgi:hypothetical protein